MSVSKYDYDIGIDKDRMFIDLALDQKQAILSKKLINNFKNELIRKTKDHHVYYIIPSKSILIYLKHIYEYKDAKIMVQLFENGFTKEDITKYFHIPNYIINDLLNMFSETKKWADSDE